MICIGVHAKCMHNAITFAPGLDLLCHFPVKIGVKQATQRPVTKIDLIHHQLWHMHAA